MSSTFEEILCAIAVKNGMVSREVAMKALADFDAQPMDKPARPVVELLIESGAVTLDQAALLDQAARKVALRQETASMPAPKASPAAPPGNPSEPVAGYKIARKVGVGGMATVFEATDRQRRRVALKILQPAKARDAKALAAFRREAELLVRFDHPNLVKGHDQGQSGPLAWVAMEFLDGESVQEALDRDGPIPEARALEIILETAKALEYIQQQGIVHRDVKPGNIMIGKSGAVKLCDLGFAAPIGGDSGAADQETTSGTVQYMAPEQARGQSGVDARADIYALGASLYHMVMGEVPFQGGDSLEVMAKQVLEALNSSEIKNRRLSKHMLYFIERMMSKDKTLRYSTPHELIEDINQQIEGFRSLEYKPDAQAKRSTSIIKGLQAPPAGGRPSTRIRPGTGKFRQPPRGQ